MAATPHIARLHAQNFRCLRDVKVNFAPLTLLVGPNASGKSTILEALQYKDHVGQEKRWQRRPLLKTRILVTSDADSTPTNERFISTFMELGEDFISYNYGSHIEEHRGILSWTHQLIRLDTRELRTPNKPATAGSLSVFGENLTNLYVSLSRKQQGALVERFKKLVPAIQDINVIPIDGGMLELRFTDAWNEELVYTPNEVSDGTMFVLAFLCLQYQPTPPDILLIEEPERGLHPYLMEQVMTLLRALAHGELGPKQVQVVMATHSAELLEYARPEEVRFINRSSKDGATTVYEPPVNDPEWRAIFGEYNDSLASMWLSGNLGGVPRSGGR